MTRHAKAPYGSGRMTATRRDILRALDEVHEVFTAEELLGRLKERGSRVGRATVYRALSTLEQTGRVERIGVRGTSALYAHCGATDRHHHHLVCTSCGCVSHTACPIDETVLTGADAGGFVVTGHDIVLYGLCPACTSKKGVA